MRTFKCPPVGFHLHVWSRHVCCWLVSCCFTARLFRTMTSAHWQQQLSWSLTSKPSLVRPAGFVVSAFYLNKLFPFHRVQHWSKVGDFFLFLMRLGFCAFFPWFVLNSVVLDLGFLFFAAHLLSTWNMVSCPAVEEQLDKTLEKQQKWRLDCWTFHFFLIFYIGQTSCLSHAFKSRSGMNVQKASQRKSEGMVRWDEMLERGTTSDYTQKVQI